MDEVWRPWEKAVQAVKAVQRPTKRPTGTPTTSSFRPIAPTPTTTSSYRPIAPTPSTEVSSMPPPKLPGIKVRITTVQPYRISSISTPARPTTRPEIPSANSDFLPYHPKMGDSWIVKPATRIHLIRQRDVTPQWATLTQLERPPTKE